jgi:hypothetical protein
VRVVEVPLARQRGLGQLGDVHDDVPALVARALHARADPVAHDRPRAVRADDVRRAPRRAAGRREGHPAVVDDDVAHLLVPRELDARA